MRLDRKATARGHSKTQQCVSFYIKGVCEKLKANGTEIKPENLMKRIQHFPINTTNPVWFLNDESKLDYIPTSKALRRVHAQQRKACCQIYTSVFETDVISTLDEG